MPNLNKQQCPPVCLSFCTVSLTCHNSLVLPSKFTGSSRHSLRQVAPSHDENIHRPLVLSAAQPPATVYLDLPKCLIHLQIPWLPKTVLPAANSSHYTLDKLTKHHPSSHDICQQSWPCSIVTSCNSFTWILHDIMVSKSLNSFLFVCRSVVSVGVICLHAGMSTLA